MRGISHRALAGFAILIAATSLLGTLYLLSQLRRAEATLAPLRPFLAELVGPDGSMQSEIRVPAGTPINLDIPIDERVVIRVDTMIPIRTRITVPLRSPLGNYDIPVPIRANVPLRGSFPIHFRDTFRLRATTPADIVVPIEMGR